MPAGASGSMKITACHVVAAHAAESMVRLLRIDDRVEQTRQPTMGGKSIAQE
jgi:hypothetical protein